MARWPLAAAADQGGIMAISGAFLKAINDITLLVHVRLKDGHKRNIRASGYIRDWIMELHARDATSCHRAG
jgi:hypothetical protein